MALDRWTLTACWIARVLPTENAAELTDDSCPASVKRHSPDVEFQILAVQSLDAEPAGAIGEISRDWL